MVVSSALGILDFQQRQWGQRLVLLAPEESGGVAREDPLQQHADQFRSLVESSPDLFFRLSKAGTVVYRSPVSQAMFGCDPEFNHPDHYLAFVASASQSLAKQAFRLLLAGAHVQDIVLSMMRPDGRLIRVAVYATPWFSGNQCVGVQGRIRELSVQEIDQRLSAATSIGIGLLHRGKLQVVNESLARMIGSSPAALRGLDWCELLIGMSGASGARLEPTSHEVGPSQSLASQWRRQDGSVVDVLCSINPLAVTDASCPPDCALAVLDITASKQAEHDLLGAYADLEQMFNVAAPICLLSLECRLLKANRAFCVFFGCQPEDMLGKTGQEIWGCQACDTEACPLRQMIGGIAPAYLEIDTVIHGRSLVCTLHAVGYVDAAGRMGGMVITFFDGQERKKIAQELLNAQQQLIQAEKLSAIGSLAASIAHEFNNPLCGVRSVVARIARRSGLDAADQSLLKLALEECDRMTRLIKDLQQFNQPFTDIRETFDLHRAIDSVLLLLNKYLKIRKALVHQAYASGPIRIVGAENQIKQVLLNLLRNCSEALPEKGGTIRVETCRDHGNVRVVLSDNGVGISAEHLPHLFEPFFTTKPAVKEVGLGLSVSYGIIKGHGGDILVESTPGTGTTFTVVLPVGEHSEQEH